SAPWPTTNKMQLTIIAPVISKARAVGELRASQGKGAALTSLRAGSQHSTITTGAPSNQKVGALAIIMATRTPIKLVSTLPRSIRHAARMRGRRGSKRANSTDLTSTAPTNTTIDPDRAIAGTMTCMNGTTGSQARVGFAANEVSTKTKS